MEDEVLFSAYPGVRAVYEKIMALLPDTHVSPYQVFLTGKKVIGKKMTHFLKTVQETPWALSWDNLKKISIPGQEGLAFSMIVTRKCGSDREKCSLCWRDFEKTYKKNGKTYKKKQTTCSIHLSKNVKEYFRYKRLLPAFKEKLSSITPAGDKMELLENIGEYPNVYRYLRSKDIEIEKLRGTKGSLKILEALYAPQPLDRSDLFRLYIFQEEFDTLRRAEAWLSLLDPLTGQPKGWGGARKGSGRPRKFLSPSCHPESVELAEIEGDRAN